MRFSGVVLLTALLQNVPPPPPLPVRIEVGLPPQSSPPQNVPQEPGSVDGVVIEAGSGRPLPGVTVQLQARSVGLAAGMLVTSTRDDGAFSFRSVPPGGYLVQAQRAGYIPQVFGPPPDPFLPAMVTSQPIQQVLPGQKLSGIRLALTRAAVISGRLIDDRGEVVVGAVVQALKTTYRNGLRQRTPVQSTISNDLGEYRLFMLRPGEYHLNVVPPLLVPSLRPESTAIPFYFPGTIDAKAAKPIELHEGEMLDAVNFLSVPTRTRRVGGAVQGNGGDPVAAILSPLNGTSSVERTLDSDNPVFQFLDVVPGSYILVARTHATRSAISIDVGNADLQSVRISLGSGLRIPTHVRIEGHAPGNDPEVETLYFLVRSENPIRGLDNETYSPFADGRFTLEVLPGDYRLDISRQVTYPVDYYVKSMTLNGVDVLNPGLHATGSTDATMEIVVATDSGSVEGRIDGRTNGSDRGREGTVVLVPDAVRRGQRTLYKSMKTSGPFRFEKVPPGDYKLFAWAEADVENGGPWLDPEYLRKYEDGGTPVRIDADKKTIVDRTIRLLNP